MPLSAMERCGSKQWGHKAEANPAGAPQQDARPPPDYVLTRVFFSAERS
jgi:hypothetical protein